MTAVVFAVVIGGVVPCTLAVLRGELLSRLAAVQALSGVTTIALLVFARAVGRPSYLDVGLVLALLSFAGVLVFARFFGKTL